MRCGSRPNGAAPRSAPCSSSASQTCSRVRARQVQLVAELADEADAQAERRHSCDLQVPRVEIREGVVRHVRVGDALHQRAGVRPGDVDRGHPAGQLDELDVHEPDGVPPGEPLVDAVGPGRRRRHVEGVVVEPRDRAVVHDPARVRRQHAVADAADLQVGEAVRVDAVEERARVRPLDEDLAERRDVDQADAAVHALRLLAGVRPVRVGAAPGAGPHHAGAELLVAVVQRRALGRLLRIAGDEAHRDRRVRRPRRRRADRVLVQPGRLRVDADRVDVAEPALARPHRHRRVALRELDRVEALGDRVLEVLRRLVLAEADEALVAGVAEHRARHRGRADVAGDRPDGLDAGRAGRAGRRHPCRRRTRPGRRPARAACSWAAGCRT